MIGCGLSPAAVAVRGNRPLAAMIAQLFKSGEQGVWYDPSDLSTLYQDSAGTTPVTAVEQPVGLMLDKSGRGNSATQSASSSRPAVSTTARKVRNLLPANTNNNIAINSNTTPAPTNNVALVGAPEGITYGFQIAHAATGFIQANVSIPADTNWYEWSCIVFNTSPGGGAVFRTSVMGISGVANTGLAVSYAFDTQIGNVTGLQVVDLGGNYFRLSILFKNNLGTLWIHRLDSGPGMEKLVISGQQLVSVADSVIRPRMYGYASKGVLSSPYYGFGSDGLRYIDNTSQPYSHINAWGDSFVGSGTNHTWAKEFTRLYGEFRNNGVGGETSTQIKARMLASVTTATDIVIIECGRNNPVLATVMADIADMVAAIPHGKYVVCAICNRNDQIDEQAGGAGYSNIIAINNAMAATYPDNYVDIRAALIAAYNPNDPAEVAAHALDITTARLQGDGLHPTDDGQVAITSAIWQFMVSKGFIDLVGAPSFRSIGLDGFDDSAIVANGGGATAAFFWCSAIRVGKVGAVQTLFSDAGTNTGYRVGINASNQLELSAGNGTAYTTVATAAALALNQTAVLTAWHDGVNLNVQIDNGAIASTPFAIAVAGTEQITIGKDNNVASSYFQGSAFSTIYVKDDVQTAAQISSAKRYCASKAGVAL